MLLACDSLNPFIFSVSIMLRATGRAVGGRRGVINVLTPGHDLLTRGALSDFRNGRSLTETAGVETMPVLLTRLSVEV